MHLSKPGSSRTMTTITYKSPFPVVLLFITATLLAVVGRHAASAQGVNPQSCFINCRLSLISCATGCRIGAGPFPLYIRFCLGQCSLRNFQCLQSCTNPSPTTQPPPLAPPIYHRPPHHHRPILPPIFHRPPGTPILPPIFHRPPRRPILPPIFHIPPAAPVIPAPPQLTSSIINRPTLPPSLSTTQEDPRVSSPQSLSDSAIINMPLPAQPDRFGKGN